MVEKITVAELQDAMHRVFGDGWCVREKLTAYNLQKLGYGRMVICEK